jgi:hypothetical protein
MEEKRVLVEELQLLRARIDRNPELTRFAAENIRLLDHIKRLILYHHFIFLVYDKHSSIPLEHFVDT